MGNWKNLHPFTRENAREMQRRSAAAARRNKQLREEDLIRNVTLSLAPTGTPGVDLDLAKAIRTAEQEVLLELRESTSALAKMRLARCLRDLGERYQLAVGANGVKGSRGHSGRPRQTAPLGLAGEP